MKKACFFLLFLVVTICLIACDGSVNDQLYDKSYITFKSSAPFTITPSYTYYGVGVWDGILEYSTDPQNSNSWKVFPKEVETTATSALVGSDYCLYIRGKNTVITAGEYDAIWTIESEKELSCSGNIMTLLDYKNPDNAKMGKSCFSRMFMFSTSLTDISELVLPAEDLSDYCYFLMFCWTGVKSTPELPATKLAKGCYYGMFSTCKSLTSVKPIAFNKSAILAEDDSSNSLGIPGCFDGMFSNCSSLKVTTSTDGTLFFRCPDNVGSLKYEHSVRDMFTYTGGNFTGTPVSGTDYYWTV